MESQISCWVLSERESVYSGFEILGFFGQCLGERENDSSRSQQIAKLLKTRRRRFRTLLYDG